MASVCRVWTRIRSAGGSISVYAGVASGVFPLYGIIQKIYSCASIVGARLRNVDRLELGRLGVDDWSMATNLSENLLNGRDLAAARDAYQTRDAEASKTAHTAGALAARSKHHLASAQNWPLRRPPDGSAASGETEHRAPSHCLGCSRPATCKATSSCVWPHIPGGAREPPARRRPREDDRLRRAGRHPDGARRHRRRRRRQAPPVARPRARHLERAGGRAAAL